MTNHPTPVTGLDLEGLENLPDILSRLDFVISVQEPKRHVTFAYRDDGKGTRHPVVIRFEDLGTVVSALRASEAERERLTGDAKAALKECVSLAAQAGEAKGKLEASELAGVVEGWQHRATKAEALAKEQAERIAFLEKGVREAQDSLRFNQDDVIWFGGASLETLWEHLEAVRDPEGLDPGCPEDDRTRPSGGEADGGVG